MSMKCPANDYPAGLKDFTWWCMLQNYQKVGEKNLENLENAVNDLCRALRQKTAGQPQYAKKNDINHKFIDHIAWTIVLESTALVLSNSLKVKETDCCVLQLCEDNKEIDRMWAFSMPGGQEADVESFKELKDAVDELCEAIKQKNAGHADCMEKIKVDWYGLDRFMWQVIFTATALVLSGRLALKEA